MSGGSITDFPATQRDMARIEAKLDAVTSEFRHEARNQQTALTLAVERWQRDRERLQSVEERVKALNNVPTKDEVREMVVLGIAAYFSLTRIAGFLTSLMVIFGFLLFVRGYL